MARFRQPIVIVKCHCDICLTDIPYVTEISIFSTNPFAECNFYIQYSQTSTKIVHNYFLSYIYIQNFTLQCYALKREIYLYSFIHELLKDNANLIIVKNKYHK